MNDNQEDQRDLEVSEAGAQSEDSKPLELTDRDIAMFRLIHEHRYLAFNQIEEAFWKDCSPVARAANKRVQKLLRAGYLEQGYSKSLGLGLYLLSDKSFEELRKRGMDIGLSKYRLTTHFEKFINHDLKVTDLRILFRELGADNWITERVLKEVRRGIQVPDGILNVRGHQIAIEFESAMKSRFRYIRSFERYNANPDYFLVFVIVYRELTQWLLDIDYNPEQVWFVEYKELMKKRGRVLFENKYEKFELERIL